MKSCKFFSRVYFSLFFLFTCVPIYSQQSDDSNDELLHELGKGFSEAGENFNESLRQLVKNISIQNENNRQLNTAIYITLGVISVIFIFLIIFMIVQSIMNLKFQKMQEKQFESTLNLIKETQRIITRSQLTTLDKITPGLPGVNEIEKNELQSLAEECEALGEKIDKYTNRRNNSKNVSELVFKISQHFGVGHDVATIYFCASMVYDAGFLSIPADFFMTDILSTAERKKIKTHVEKATAYLSFVPEPYISIFKDACSFHHENMNGTGYPKGSQADEIPLIARLIHVAESYVSLVSHRSYHKIRDKESAIAELRRQPGIYDSDVVDALEAVV